ncbi:hypothetical protein COCON_G00135760 [Conger conger]|uniref:Uncharacterized protein n=1 Tax=Conger conger TaxID=82655 RepID=A0A9Q1HXX3_CONCO|nr:hypothetical protein COCON_G00135760 [Conger conger]
MRDLLSFLQATDIQAKYIELLTHSGDYYKFLGDLQNNMQLLKVGTGVLEEELRWLLAQYWSQTNQYLADSLARYQLDSKQELRSLQESLDKALRDYRAATEKLDRLTAELKALQQQLTQEQAQVREVNIRYETLYKTIEEKSKMLNDHSRGIQRLQGMTKERLEEELRALRQGRVQKNEDEQKQLWKRYELKYDTEKVKTVQELTSLRSEIEKLTALEDRNKGQLQSSERVVSELARIRDELEKGRAQKNEDELKQLQKVVEEWKSQYERKSDTDKGKLQQELKSLTSEIKMLTAKLRALEVGYKKCSHTSTCISSFEVQLQTIKKTVEQGLTQKNHDIETLTTKLQSFEQVVSELARIRHELEKGRVQKNEDELKQLRKLYELKYDTDKGKLQQELESLRKQFEEQLQTIIKKVEQELTQNNHEIEKLTAKLRVLEDRYKGRLQISEQKLQRELKLFQKRLEDLEKRIKVHHHVITIKEITVRGICGWVSITALVESKLLNPSDVQKIAQGQLTIEDIESKLKRYLQGSGCIAGIFLEKENRTLPIYQAKKEGLLRPGTSLVLLEAQAASGFMIDPLNKTVPDCGGGM